MKVSYITQLCFRVLLLGLHKRMDGYNGRRQFYRTRTKPFGLKVLVDFKENPKAAQEHTKNHMMMNKIQKVVNVGIVKMR
ncbi:stress-induced-phosphoprotein 1 [Vigna unguiculata]|uniref:Stress-induced-phosphoprotein 1 n=1 Tax=Vigna unguiculata TaxID=3917 RepID=A0A4D6MQ61_VIGUN|nr:stress-induced-phosphoprotein 1 [Vigna unguiculata]